jgi:hypothetical protein
MTAIPGKKVQVVARIMAHSPLALARSLQAQEFDVMASLENLWFMV